MKWKAGLAVLLLVSITGCGNAANQAGNAAGNAAGWVGQTVGNGVNTTGNALRQTGNVIGGAAGQAGNAVGNTTRWGLNRAGGMAGGLAGATANGGTQSVQFHPATRTIDIRLSGGAAANTGRGGTAAGAGALGTNRRGANVAGTWNHASTITVPTGWTVRVTPPTGANWANNVYVVPYRATDANRAGGAFATAPDTGPFGGPTWNGATGVVRPGAAAAGTAGTAGGTSLAGGKAFAASKPGMYAIVVNGNGYTNHLIDFINVTNQNTSPSIVTSHVW